MLKASLHGKFPRGILYWTDRTNQSCRAAWEHFSKKLDRKNGQLHGVDIGGVKYESLNVDVDLV